MQSTVLNVKIKKMLSDIIEEAFKGNILLNRYKSFYITILNKELKTTSGCYNPQKHELQIYSLCRDTRAVLKTCLHEAAHHIDCCNRGESSQGEEFYEAYKKLIHASLNMGIFQPEDFKKDNSSNDRNKVLRIVEAWIPREAQYHQLVTVKISNGYEWKDYLKENGFKWNKLEKTWEKENCEHDIIEYLDEHSISYRMENFSNIEIDATVSIVASGCTYESKEKLKENGFRFCNKQWVKKTKSQAAKNEVAHLTKFFYGCAVSFKIKQ